MTEPKTVYLNLSDANTVRRMIERHEAYTHPCPGDLPGESCLRDRPKVEVP